MRRHWTRRRFLRQAAVLPGALGLGPLLAGSRDARGQSPNEKLDIAVIGCTGRGGANLNGVSGENIVALCDVDRNNLATAAKKHPKAQTFRDFRRMLDRVAKQVDAVVVSTPDHTHAPAAARALRLGKHCYCEKPLTHDVHEARVVTRLAEENHLVTQMGTQIHAGANYRRVVELVRAGAIGPIDEVHVWHSGTLGGQDRPKETPPVPASLDWDLWLGPAPQRPYHPCYVPKRWRAWWDFGNGTLGDFGCHYMDLPFWALDLRYPQTVEAEGPPPNPETTAPQLIVRYEFPQRGDLPPVRLTWSNGSYRPPLLKQENLPNWSAGVLLVGSKGLLQADYSRHQLYPTEKFADFVPPQPTIPDSIGHHAEWIQACKTGGQTTCHFGYSGVLAEAVLLGNVAYRVGEKLHWNAKNLTATNCPQAEHFVTRPYRPGWTL